MVDLADKEEAEAVFSALKSQSRGMVLSDLHSATGINKTRIRSVLRSLMAREQVQMNGGRYVIPPTGKPPQPRVREAHPSVIPKGFDAIRAVIRLHAEAVQARGEGQLELRQGDPRLEHGLNHPLSAMNSARVEVPRNALYRHGKGIDKRSFLCGPLYLGQRSARDSSLVWKPVFLAPVSIVRRQETIGLELESDIQVNQSWLDSVCGRAAQSERDDLLVRLGFLTEKESGSLEARAVRNIFEGWTALERHCPELEWVETRSQSAQPQFADLASREKPGLYGYTLLLPDIKLPFEQGLLDDLRKISEASDNEIEASALAHVFESLLEPTEIDARPKFVEPKKPLILNGLNEQQVEAVEDALVQPLTVIQGPPGTGKSTVVRAAMKSLALAGQTAIFASRNHRAINEIAPAINRGLDEAPLVADLRKDQFEGEWWSLLLDALSRGKRAHVEDLAEKLAALGRLREELEALGEECAQALILGSQYAELSAELAELKKELAKSFYPNTPTEVDVSPSRIDAILEAIDAPMWKPQVWIARALLLKYRWSLRRAIPVGSRLNRDASILQLRTIRSEHRVAKAEEALRHTRNLNEINIQTFDAELKVAEREQEALAAFAMACATSVDIPNASLSRIRAESQNSSRQAKARLAEICSRHLRDLLPALPLWSTSTLSVGKRVPLVAGAFDLAIIDEAAQCDPSSIIPVLYRARRALIVGDPKQLPPVQTIAARKEEHLREILGLAHSNFSIFGASGRSAYDLAFESLQLQGRPRILLKEHFRCHPLIANLVNRHFYGNELLIRTSVSRSDSGSQGLKWTHVAGGSSQTSGSLHHPPLTEAVLKELKSLYARNYDGSVGVVTPFKAQAKRIQDAAEREISRRWLDGCEFIASTADGFQGGEKDLIIMALVGGGDTSPRTPRFYKRDENRFNVAISRAKNFLHVFGDKGWASECDVSVVRALYQACDYTEEEDSQPLRSDLIGPVWEPLLAQELRKADIEFKQQYKACGFYLDFAIFPASAGESGAGKMVNIEVDGETYHRDSHGKLRAKDVRRDTILKSAGWRVQRFWVYELRDDLPAVMEKIKELVELR